MNWLSVVKTLDGGQIFGIFFQIISNAIQEGSSVGILHLAPVTVVEGMSSGLDSEVDVLLATFLDLANLGLCGRIDGAEGFSRN